MASDQCFKDLQWFLQTIKDPQHKTLNLHKISFFICDTISQCIHSGTSMNLNVTRDNLSYLCKIFIELATALETQTSLRSLVFDAFEWEMELLRSLGVLLDNSSKIKQLVFRQNRFSELCLREISEILKRNGIIREVTFMESCIGCIGATLIASALEMNDSLEELKIWGDSIGTKGAEKLSEMIETNSKLKRLTILDSSPSTATPLISAVLARNRKMEVHAWTGDPKRDRTWKVVEFSHEDTAVKIYQIDVSGSCRLAGALGMNTTVASLDMTGVKLKSRWAMQFRWVLEQNQTLKEVKLSETGLKDKALVYIAAGLFKNKSLQSLYVNGNPFGGVGVEHLLCPLSRFSSLQLQANITLRKIVFGGPKTKIGRDGLKAILKMVTTNQTIVQLRIYDDESLRSDDFVEIFKGLQKNASMRRLSLQGCKGVHGERVLEAIAEMLEVNPLIEDLDLARTPLKISGKVDEICQKLAQNGKPDEPETETLSFNDMPHTQPKSCRVFFCGQQFAGKTTVCNSILQCFSSSKFPYVEQVRTLINPVERAVRAVGIKIKTFQDEDIKISMWNLAGHHEFYALHDLMFPGYGSPSLFVIISSLCKKPNNKEVKSAAEVEADLLYWLRFIASNSRTAAQQCMKPNITIVLTHCERIDQQSQSFQTTVSSIQRLRDLFQDSVGFYPTVFTVDARSSASVSKLAHHLRNTCRAVLGRVPRVYQLCNDMIQHLSEWRSTNYNKPMMRWEEFNELCQVKVPFLRKWSRNNNKEMMETRRRTIATCLHDMGEVIYFEEWSFLILDCEWFCGEVLVQLMKLDAIKQSNGFVRRQKMQKILKGNNSLKIFENFDDDADELVRIMMKLEMCYEQDPSDEESPLLIPSILEDGRGKPQKWQMMNMADCVYAGRHFRCDDSSHVFLTTPGFFSRLQIRLHNRIMELKNQHGATCKIEKYLIVITINGISIRVEIAEVFGNCIDILASSAKNLIETLKFIHQFIMPEIQSLCQGVILLENIIRPECVQTLTPPRFRQTQSVTMAQLKEALLSFPAESMYDYQHTWTVVLDSGKPVMEAGFDFARDLLSEDDFRQVLQQRCHDLHDLAQELRVYPETAENSVVSEANNLEKVDPSFNGIAKGIQTVLQRLKIIEQEIRDLKQEIRGLRLYEERLMILLHHKVDYLVNYNFQIDERKVPNMFYFIRVENYTKRLITAIVPGMSVLRLHMLCEFRQEMHVVEEQEGCEVMKIDNHTVKCLAPYMNKFMKLLTLALRIGVQLAAGMGHMIPDLGREITHLTGSGLMVGAAAAGAIGVAAVASGGRRSRARDVEEQEVREAQQWMVDFLRDRKCSSGKDIADKFGLWRVRYRDDGSIAWICKRHMIARAHQLVQVPL